MKTARRRLAEAARTGVEGIVEKGGRRKGNGERTEERKIWGSVNRDAANTYRISRRPCSHVSKP
jgi:hypothetical protein